MKLTPTEAVVHGFTIDNDLVRPGMTFDDAHRAYQISLRRRLSGRQGRPISLAAPRRNWRIAVLLCSASALAVASAVWFWLLP